MPTSSQALILKVTDGHLPPIFGRRVWRPALSQNYPISNHNISNRLIHIGDNLGLKHGHFRVSSAQNHKASNELNALSGLLRVQGLKGDLAFDASIGSLCYRVDELPSIRYDGWTEFKHRNKPEYVRRATDLGSTRRHRRLNINQRRHAFVNVLRDGRKTEECSQEDADYFKLVKTVNGDSDTLIKESTSRGERNKGLSAYEIHRHLEPCRTHPTTCETRTAPTKGISTEIHPAKYTHVTKHTDKKTQGSDINAEIETHFDKTNETKDATETETKSDASNDNTVHFRLIKALPNETGAFRLAKTTPRELGEFYLVPPDGHESNDFRLVSSEKPGCYDVFMANSLLPDTFSLLEPEQVQGDEFKLISAKVCDGQQYSVNHNNSTSDDQIRYFKQNKKDCEGYSYSNDILAKQPCYDTSARKEISLPDVLYDNPNKQSNTVAARDGPDDSYDFNSEEFAAKYLQNVNHNSSEVYERLAHLGFRNPGKGVPIKNLAKSNDTLSGSSSKLASTEWRTFNFDKWTRTTDATPILEDMLTVESARLVQPNQTSDVGPSKASLIEELKTNSNYKQWKRKKVTSVRARKELPPEDPTAVCLTLSDNAISHDVLMQHVQRGTGNQLLSLQFDPISVHTCDGEAKSQWILRFSDSTICDRLLTQGIRILGKFYPLRRFDEVMREEYDAYKFNEILQQINDHKSKKQQKKNKKLKTKEIQTQTPIGA